MLAGTCNVTHECVRSQRNWKGNEKNGRESGLLFCLRQREGNIFCCCNILHLMQKTLVSLRIFTAEFNLEGRLTSRLATLSPCLTCACRIIWRLQRSISCKCTYHFYPCIQQGVFNKKIQVNYLLKVTTTGLLLTSSQQPFVCHLN